MSFDEWMKALDSLGQKEGFFDDPERVPLCPGSIFRRPYAGPDGLFFQCYESGMTPQQALGEIGIED